MNVNVMMQYVTYGLAMIGGLAFLVSIIVQVIKELPFLKRIPTSVVALVASMVLCPVALIILCTYLQDKDYLVLYTGIFYGCLCCVSGFNRRMGKK